MLKTKYKRKRINHEDKEQIALIQWAQLNPITRKYLFHIPNGGTRNLLEATKLKNMGVKKGVSDLLLAYPSKGKHGLWVELKRRERNKAIVSDEQISWLNDMEQLDYAIGIAYGWEEASNIIKNYLST